MPLIRQRYAIFATRDIDSRRRMAEGVVIRHTLMPLREAERHATPLKKGVEMTGAAAAATLAAAGC